MKMSAKCTICHCQVFEKNVNFTSHPQLGVLICKKCESFLEEGQWSKDSDGNDEYCRWCGDGGKLLLCDFCSNAYHRECIRRNLKREFVSALLGDSWKCPLCDPKPIRELQETCHRMIESAAIQLQQKPAKPSCSKKYSATKDNLEPKSRKSDSGKSDSKQKPFDLLRMIRNQLDVCKQFSPVCQHLIATLQQCSIDEQSTVTEVAQQFKAANRKMLQVCKHNHHKLDTRRPELVQMPAEDSKVIWKKSAGKVPESSSKASTPSHGAVSPPSDEDSAIGSTASSSTRKLFSKPKKQPSLGKLLLDEFSSSSPDAAQSQIRQDDSGAAEMTELTSVEISLFVNSSSNKEVTVPESDKSSDASIDDDVLDIGDEPLKSAKEMEECSPKKEGSPVLFGDSDSCDRASVKSEVLVEEDSLLLESDRLLKVDVLKSQPKMTKKSRKKLCAHSVKTSNWYSSSGEESGDEGDGNNAVVEPVCSQFDIDLPEHIDDDNADVDHNLTNVAIECSDDASTDKSTSSDSDDQGKKGSQKGKKKKCIEEKASSDDADEQSDANQSTTSSKETLKQKSEDSDIARLLRLPSDAESSSEEEHSEAASCSKSIRTRKTITSPKRVAAVRRSGRTVKKLVQSSDDSSDNAEAKAESDGDGDAELIEIDKESSEEDSYDSQAEQESSSVDDAEEESGSEFEVGSKSRKNKGRGKEKSKKRRKKEGKGQKKRKRVKVDSSSDESNADKKKEGKGEENGEAAEEEEDGSRKKIRKIIKDKDLKAETKQAQQAERMRIDRLREKQQEYNFITLEEVDHESSQSTSSSSPTKSQKVKRVILEADDSAEAMVEVCSTLVDKLKPHQAEGIKFLYDCTVESLSKLDSGGSGAILAHCMGLGKTLQVITFLHTILNDERFKLDKVLIVAPLNAVLNWKNEFEKWLGEDSDLRIFEMASVKENFDRAKILGHWHKSGGVMIMGYQLFRILTTGARIKNKKQKETFKKCLLEPGPDLVICDEGHMLKNHSSAIFKSMDQIRTKRRMCLTGTPLQNNLGEYHTMVSFVKPGLLGTAKEFSNRFANPIKNGQHVDSTQRDVLIMKRRAHVLFDMLKGCVHRRDYSALTRFLPPKYEYILSVRLSANQVNLYNKYLREVVGSTDTDSLRYRRSLLPDFNNLQRVWTHPWALQLQEIEREKKMTFDDDEEEDFIDDDVSDDSDDEKSKRKKQKSSAGADGGEEEKDDKEKQEEAEQGEGREEVVKKWFTRRRAKDGEEDEDTPNNRSKSVSPAAAQHWFSDCVKEEDAANPRLSGKIMLLLAIIRKCEEIGDKLLVFSQSLISLNLVESILNEIECKEAWPEQSQKSLSNIGGQKWGWQFGLDYLRMDGSTSAKLRDEYASKFNDVKNDRTRLFLISTKAGGVGINLVAANRVVIFDASWNPANDTQSIFRTYRFGQDKPVYVYRLIAQGTMEEKIYDRQVTKQSLSCRVVDEQQIDRHFSAADLEELYAFEPDDEKAKRKRPLPAVPKDRLLADLLMEEKDWLCTYHEHESLLMHHEEQQLSKEERQAAWDEYENERSGRASVNADNSQYILELKLQRLMQQGDALIAQSGEEVRMSMQQLVVQLRQKPEFSFNLLALVEKVHFIVGEMQTRLRKNNAMAIHMQQMAAASAFQEQQRQLQQHSAMAAQGLFPGYFQNSNYGKQANMHGGAGGQLNLSDLSGCSKEQLVQLLMQQQLLQQQLQQGSSSAAEHHKLPPAADL